MNYLKHFGFKVFRLREEKAESEYLLYNMNTNTYAKYSSKRIVSVLKDEFHKKGIDLEDFARKELGYEQSPKPEQMINTWLDKEKELVDYTIFYPSSDIIVEKNNKEYFNTFNFIDTLDSSQYARDEPMSYEEFKEKAPYHHKLFYNLHNKDEEAIKDTLLKMADKVQYPDQKSQDCIVFYPGEGAGKGIFYKYVILPIFKQYAKKILMKRLSGEFNGYLKDCLVLAIEEGKRDPELIEILKEAITEPTMLINEKGVNQSEMDVFFLTFVFSNNMNPIDLGKRRGSYHMTHPFGNSVEESQAIGREICENIGDETPYLLEYLHSLQFEHQEALMPYNTTAKEQVNDLNKTPIELFYDYLVSYDSLDKAVNELRKERYMNETSFEFNIETLKRRGSEENEYFISKDLIREAYNNFCHMEGLRTNIIKHNKDIVELWALMQLPEDAHQRITVKSGKDEGRKLDHVRLKDIQDHIRRVNNNDGK